MATQKVKSSGYSSRGERPSVSKKITKSVKAQRSYAERYHKAFEAYIKGKPVKTFGFGDLPEYRHNNYNGGKK